jgi:hypothetical protein
MTTNLDSAAVISVLTLLYHWVPWCLPATTKASICYCLSFWAMLPQEALLPLLLHLALSIEHCCDLGIVADVAFKMIGRHC